MAGSQNAPDHSPGRHPALGRLDVGHRARRPQGSHQGPVSDNTATIIAMSALGVLVVMIALLTGANAIAS